jgi:uncharacterized membrane protein YidH (DUF202 family)
VTDLITRLALYRTHLAEKRTATSELQFGIVLISLPLTLHTALMLLAGRYPLAASLLRLLPLFMTVLAIGAIFAAHASVELVRAELAIRRVRAMLRESEDSQKR